MSPKKAAEAPETILDARFGHLTIEERPIEKLVPYARNARTHSDAQVAQLAGSIREFGWTNPVLVDENDGIIAGHGRVLAARKLEMDTVPVIVLRGLSETQKRALILADNRLALNAGWDTEMLAVELQDLKIADFDVDVLGFDVKEMEQYLKLDANKGKTDDDEVPEVKTYAVSGPGDMWLLGDHRLLCGDSTVITDAERLIAGQKVDLIFTDPPYGVDFQQAKFNGCEASKKTAAKRNFAPIANDKLKGDDLTEFIRQAMVVAFAVSKQAAFYVWAPPLLPGAAIRAGVVAAGWKVQSQIVWHKIPFVLGRADYHWQHEIAWYGFKEEGGHAWYGGRDKGTVWSLNRTMKSDLHPTMKPVELAEMAINNSSKGGDIVLDLFGGSGSTLIACEKLGRAARMMELEPAYVDTIVTRWQNYTGRQATLDGDGRTFDEIKAERHVTTGTSTTADEA